MIKTTSFSGKMRGISQKHSGEIMKNLRKLAVKSRMKSRKS
jgi:hypothetical protein